VTLVMAYLNGNHVPNLLRLRTLVSKFVGTICSVAAGLPMGPEGPMVHMGACVASVITYAQCSESYRRRPSRLWGWWRGGKLPRAHMSASD
jgi:H+/Cl- antiporter ClcA